MFIFFRVKENETIRRRLKAMPAKKKTPIRRGPAGCPALLRKGRAQLNSLRSDKHFALVALSCDARRPAELDFPPFDFLMVGRVLKGKVKP